MKTINIVTAGAALAASFLVLSAAAQAQDMPEGNLRASAQLQNTDGQNIGSVALTQTPNGVHLYAKATNIPEGIHGFHIHETGKCDAQDGFKSAGGHFAEGKEHGYEAKGGPHPGDMPNVHVQSDGILAVEYLNEHITLAEGKDGYLFDKDGSSLIIHSGADDYETQPDGAAGDRIACGIIQKGDNVAAVSR